MPASRRRDDQGAAAEIVSADAASGYRSLRRRSGTGGLPRLSMPDVNTPLPGGIGYHVREGKHDIRRYDWEQYLDFADRHLER